MSKLNSSKAVVCDSNVIIANTNGSKEISTNYKVLADLNIIGNKEFKNKSMKVVNSYECAYWLSCYNNVIYITTDKEMYEKFNNRVLNNIAFVHEYEVYLAKSKKSLERICKENNIELEGN